jgi:hypothetical protein
VGSSDMERFHLEIELDNDDARRVQAVLMANDTRQHTVRQPPQLGSKKEQKSQTTTGWSLFVIMGFLYIQIGKINFFLLGV